MREAIILAGGKGTRLQSVVADVPKPMAKIQDIPFLGYVLDWLIRQNIERVILSVGYKADVIINYFGDSYKNIELVYAKEGVALGTGGGLRYALTFAQTENVLVLNGDTFFDINIQKLNFLHQNSEALVSFALHKIYNTGRYGGIEVDEHCKVQDFTSKNNIGKQWINGGIYIVNKNKYIELTTDGAFSLEDDFFQPKSNQIKLVGCPYVESYFIDIGIPEDYVKAQVEIPARFLIETAKLNTLFLDRDGVINNKIENGYVTSWQDFTFKVGILEWLKVAAKSFENIILITNQRCIGKGIISENELAVIHNRMLEAISESGGRIDKIYYCPDLNEDSPDRKPNTGMFLQAKFDIPTIDFKRSIMIGDSITDLIPAKELGMKTVFISNNKILSLHILELADSIFDSQILDV